MTDIYFYTQMYVKNVYFAQRKCKTFAIYVVKHVFNFLVIHVYIIISGNTSLIFI